MSTGSTAVSLAEYRTDGPGQSDDEQDLPDAPEPTCFVRSYGTTCDANAKKLAASGKGVVINGVLYEHEEDWPLWEEAKKKKQEGEKSSTSSRTAEETGRATATETLTGAFTATGTPDDDDDAAVGVRAGKGCIVLAMVVGLALVML